MKTTWVALALALWGCTKKDESARSPATASAVEAAAPAPAPTLPASFDRHFRGTIGEGLGIAMRVTKNGASLAGTYAYDSTKRDIALTGEMSGPSAFSLTETVDGKSTGSFHGTFAGDGSLAGTWSNATGTKTLPFALHEEAATTTAQAASAVASVSRTPIDAMTDQELASFLVRFAKARKAPGSTATVAQALDDYGTLLLHDVVGFTKKYGLPILDSSFFVVYAADVNNDGAEDFVLVSRNDVGLHNDDIIGVFTPKGSSFDELALPRSGPLAPKHVYNFARHFLSRDGEGVTMTFMDVNAASPSPVEKRYLWKGTTFKLLDTGPMK